MINAEIIKELMKRLEISKIGVYKKIERVRRDLKIVDPEIAAYCLAFQNNIRLHKYNIDEQIIHRVEDALRVQSIKIEPEKNVKKSIPEKKKLVKKISKSTIKKSKKYDVFISHATEDKKAIATPLVTKLKQRGIEVWYDQNAMKWGDSLMDSINSGLKNSLFGIVIFSESFFKKKWTLTELRTLVALANITGKKKILPLLYKISHTRLVKEYPILADILARSWNDGLDTLADEVKEIVLATKTRTKT